MSIAVFIGMVYNAGTTIVAKAKRLSEDDFAEFQVRAQMLAQARATAQMVSDGFDFWAASLRQKYKVKAKRFEIDRRTGEIIEETRVAGSDTKAGNPETSSTN